MEKIVRVTVEVPRRYRDLLWQIVRAQDPDRTLKTWFMQTVKRQAEELQAKDSTFDARGVI